MMTTGWLVYIVTRCHTSYWSHFATTSCLHGRKMAQAHLISGSRWLSKQSPSKISKQRALALAQRAVGKLQDFKVKERLGLPGDAVKVEPHQENGDELGVTGWVVCDTFQVWVILCCFFAVNGYSDGDLHSPAKQTISSWEGAKDRPWDGGFITFDVVWLPHNDQVPFIMTNLGELQGGLPAGG